MPRQRQLDPTYERYHSSVTKLVMDVAYLENESPVASCVIDDAYKQQHFSRELAHKLMHRQAFRALAFLKSLLQTSFEWPRVYGVPKLIKNEYAETQLEADILRALEDIATAGGASGAMATKNADEFLCGLARRIIEPKNAQKMMQVYKLVKASHAAMRTPSAKFSLAPGRDDPAPQLARTDDPGAMDKLMDTVEDGNELSVVDELDLDEMDEDLEKGFDGDDQDESSRIMAYTGGRRSSGNDSVLMAMVFGAAACTLALFALKR